MRRCSSESGIDTCFPFRVQNNIVDNFKMVSIGKQWGSLEVGKWKEQSMEEKCRRMREWIVVDDLMIRENNQPRIIMHIQSIRFPYLKKLHLQQNQIETVEVLALMHLPELRSLGFERNRVCSLKSFRKAFFPKIEQIGFGGNFVNELGPLLELKGKEITALGLESKIQYYVVGNNNISWLFKLQASNMRTFYVRSRYRINKNIEKFAQNGIMFKKYQNISTSTYDRLLYG